MADHILGMPCPNCQGMMLAKTRDDLRAENERLRAGLDRTLTCNEELAAERDALSAEVERLRDRPRVAEMPPAPLVRDTDGHLTVEWTLGRGEWFAMTPELLEVLVENLNVLRAALRGES